MSSKPRPLATELPTRVYVGRGLCGALPRLLHQRLGPRRAFLVTDRRLASSVAAPLLEALERAGIAATRCIVPNGEAGKSWASLERLYAALQRARVDRTTPIIAVGGGSVGDLSGFAAATWHRGVPWVGVPSTLLAQIDSSLGGKTAINHRSVKNSIGAFHHPAIVACDIDLLVSLPARELRSGLAEAVKIGCVADPAYVAWLRRRWRSIIAREPAATSQLVRRAAAIKLAVVSGDERDLGGSRAALNFGHTVGHGLEATARGALRHGEAVNWGVRAALSLSRRRGWIPERLPAEDLLAELAPPRLEPRPTARRVLRAIASDKKSHHGRRRFVLLRRSGEPRIVEDVSDDELVEVLRELELIASG